MDRREFVKATGTLLSAAALVGADHRANAAGNGAYRMNFPLNRQWRYAPRQSPEMRRRDFDDDSLQPVTLPHANIRLPWHSFDERSYQFPSVYRRRFRLPSQALGRHVFIDFEGVMTASTVWLNGLRVGEYLGGYTPFSFDLTPFMDFARENVLVVEVDSTERPDTPPFGDLLDYMTFGGIYREVSLRVVPSSFIENIQIRPTNLPGNRPGLEVDCHVQHLVGASRSCALQVELCDGLRTIALGSTELAAPARPGAPQCHTVRLSDLPDIELWDLDHPKLYGIRVHLSCDEQRIDSDTRTFGFRSARFTAQGFELNGRLVKLRGLNRHQTFPFVGGAMPARVQRRDAQILRNDLKCNIVRTSHYPQSRHFLDACDALGLLVLEEIPGWQHVGDSAWKDRAVDNVRRMIRRDWNHPSVVLWGVRINESGDDHDFYTRTNALARQLDVTRQTGGVRNQRNSELLEDVFTMNDFDWPFSAPNHPLYLNTEFVGHTYNTKPIDNTDRLIEHAIRHARAHDQLAGDSRYAGGLAWCAFDYNTHADFGSGDRVCYHGVMDIFREPKRAAAFYRSQCERSEEIVVELAHHWLPSDGAGGLLKMMVCSNCEALRLYVGDRFLREVLPSRADFPHLRHPPYVIDVSEQLDWWGDLRIEGLVGGRQVAVRHYSGRGIDQELVLAADDSRLQADGADCTRVAIRVTDEFGNIRPFSNAVVTVDVDGPADLIGEQVMALTGGVGAVWIRAQERGGTVRITATHPLLGARTAVVEVAAAPSEAV